MSGFSERTAALKDALVKKPPFCTGNFPLKPHDGEIFYRTSEGARWLDLCQATESQLEHLTQTCQPATFGLNHQDVLDESYRKAWKMDTEMFAAKFDLENSSLLEHIRAQLLDGFDEKKRIRTELYKLNVYSEGSFFKAHKDTPRSDQMFASLVITFPTAHQGGRLVLRHDDSEWSVDPAKVISSQISPTLSYTAFYSDVEHEVALVESGHRVTLTYNLYLDDKEPRSLPPPVAVNSQHYAHFKNVFSDLLADPTFLPNGGLLGFGLRFMYPVIPGATKLEDLLSTLKGSDAIVKKVCDELSLRISLKAIHTTDNEEPILTFMLEAVPDMTDWTLDTYLSSICHDEPFNGKVIYPAGEPIPLRYDDTPVPKDLAREIVWVTTPTPFSKFKSLYLAYGNEAEVDYMYCNLCLVVDIGPSNAREQTAMS